MFAVPDFSLQDFATIKATAKNGLHWWRIVVCFRLKIDYFLVPTFWDFQPLGPDCQSRWRKRAVPARSQTTRPQLRRATTDSIAEGIQNWVPKNFDQRPHSNLDCSLEVIHLIHCQINCHDFATHCSNLLYSIRCWSPLNCRHYLKSLSFLVNGDYLRQKMAKIRVFPSFGHLLPLAKVCSVVKHGGLQSDLH